MNKKVKNSISIWYKKDKIDKLDWSLAILVLAIGTFLFCYNFDLPIVVEQANDAVNILFSGKIFSFYSITMEHAVNGYYSFGESMLNSPNYNVIVYLIVGIWNLPIRLFGIILSTETMRMMYIMWAKCLIVVLGVVSAILMDKITYKLKEKNVFDNSTENIGFLFLTSTVFLFGNVIFGQFDIIAVCFVLIGLYFLVNDKMIRFCLFMSLAMCIKGFAVFILVPIVLLLEKRIIYILRNLIVGMSLPLLYKVIYRFDPAYSTVQQFMDSNYNFKGRLFAVTFSGGVANIDVLILIVGIVCAICFYIKDEEKKWRNVFIMPLAIFLAFSILVLWHPQWLVIMSPFMVFSYGLVRNKRDYLFTELLYSVGYIAVATTYLSGIDVYMLNTGILTKIVGRPYTGITFINLINQVLKLNNFIDIALTVLTVGGIGMLLVLTKFNLENNNSSELNVLNRGILWLRMIPIVGFVAVSILMYIFM